MTLSERMVKVETELKSIKNDTTRILEMIEEQVRMKENIKSNTKDIQALDSDLKDAQKENIKRFNSFNTQKIGELWGIIVLFISIFVNYIITFTKR